MVKNVVALAGLSLCLCLGASAAPAGVPAPKAQVLGSGADNPLTTQNTYTGPYDVAVVGVPIAGATNPSGSFSLAGIPAGATVQAAWVVFGTYTGDTSVVLTFAGQALPASGPAWADSGFPFETFRFDVTSRITGNGSYTFSTTGLGYAYGAALVVVYGSPTLPVRTIVVNAGAEDLYGAASTTTFAGFTGAGPGRLYLLTCADDADSGGGESLTFNGTVIPGVVYDQNIGQYTSLINQAVTVQAGTNTAIVTTAGDQFGWSLAILVGPGTAGEPVIPVATGAGLVGLALGIAGLAVAVLLRRSAA